MRTSLLSLGEQMGLPATPRIPHRYFDHPDRFVTVDEPALYPRPLRVRYKDVGSGPPLLLVHGLQTSSYSWRYNLERLGQAARVIAPDLVGSGLSDHPADFGYTPERMADFLDALRAALPGAGPDEALDRWDVVGNSVGGTYAAVYAARHPERVRRLVIVHAPGFMDRAPRWELELLRRGLVPRAAALLFGPWMVRRFQRYHRPGILSDEEVQQYSLPYRDSAGRRAFFDIVVSGLSPRTADRLAAVTAAIRAPTLLLWALRDTIIPGWTGHRWHAAISGSRLVFIPETSHFPHVETPELTAQLILDFLAPEATAPAGHERLGVPPRPGLSVAAGAAAKCA